MGFTLLVFIKIPLGNGNNPITEPITDMRIAHKFGHKKVRDEILYHKNISKDTSRLYNLILGHVKSDTYVDFSIQPTF